MYPPIGAGSKSLPKWILVISALFALMEIAVSVALLVSGSTMLENVDFTARGVDYLVATWAIRQFALGVILAVATAKRSASMLTTGYIFLLVMFIGDLCIGIYQNEAALVISAAAMSAVSAGLLFALNRATKTRLA